MLGRGLDCVGMVLCVAGDLKLKDGTGTPLHGGLYTTYSDQPVGNLVHDICKLHLIQKDQADMRPGDMVTINFAGTGACHVGILVEDFNRRLGIIHAYAGIGKVTEHLLDDKWKRRIAGCFSFPEVID